MIDHKLLTNAIRALGFTPITCPTHIPNGLCMITASADPLDARLETLGHQFGLTWELETFGRQFGYGYWVLTS